MAKPRVEGRAAKRDSKTGLLLIGAFKAFKSISLLFVGFGLIRLLHRDMAELVDHWVQVLRVDPNNHYIHKAIARVANVSPRQLREFSVGSFVYAGIYAVEGYGLLRRKRWGEYFTVISTALLIPLEVYEIFERPTAVRFTVFALNVAILIYLIVQLKKKR